MRKKGITDTERLDWLERNLLSLYHAQQTCSVYMGGEKIFGQLINEARGSGGGPTRFKVKHKSIREAVDDAMNWKKDD
jgi:hypothetical protein